MTAGENAPLCYIQSVGERELRQSASILLARVEAEGVGIEITNHGRPVARLVPIARRHRQSSTRAELIKAGMLRPGRGDILDVEPTQLPLGVPPLVELLAADRSDR